MHERTRKCIKYDKVNCKRENLACFRIDQTLIQIVDKTKFFVKTNCEQMR